MGKYAASMATPRRRFPHFYGTEWLVTLLSKCSVPVGNMLILLLWRMWQTRNDMAHGKETTTILATVEYLDNYYKSIVLAGRFSTEEILKGMMPSSMDVEIVRSLSPTAAQRSAPLAGLLALSVDGSFLKDDGTAAASMIIRNKKGEVLLAAYLYLFHCNDLLEARLHAIMLGMPLAIQHFASVVVL
ncbi:hypothetical protein D1007_48171 [Hordeum vulgare]|nr:hypothetical protein D1007_48171 [Hordeum vulgare]